MFSKNVVRKKSKLFAEQFPNLFKNISCCSKDIATRKTTKKNEIQRNHLWNMYNLVRYVVYMSPH